jgi:hypothetical protein
MRMSRPCLALLVLFPAAVLAQTASTGSISGTVRDSSHAVVPGVNVALTNTATGEARSTLTDANGNYSAGFLAPGRYRIEFSLPGFRTVVREGVTVAVTERVAVDETLSVASQKETVTVEANAEVLQSQTTTLGRVVDSEIITSLPLVTRNFTQITALSPGTSANLPDTLAVGAGSQNVFTNGGSQVSNAYSINGAGAVSSVHSAATIDLGIPGVAVPSVDTIQEFKVQTSMYDAGFGHKSGANINIITRSGTSEFHGNVYEFLRNNVLNANNFFFNSLGVPRPLLRQNQFGGTLGGPIRKDRTFFFISYEGTRQVNGASQESIRTLIVPNVPADRSAASIGAAFAGQTGSRGGLAVAASGANINPVALKLLQTKLASGEYMIPSPQRSGAGTNYALSQPARYQADQFNVNIDHQLAQKNRLSGKYFFSTTLTQYPMSGNDLLGFPTLLDAGNQNAVLSDVHIFSSKITNEARVAFTRFPGQNIGDQVVTDAQVGMFRSNQTEFPGFPNITVTGAYRFGTIPTQLITTTNIGSFADTFSVSFSGFGRHDLRIGTDTRRERTHFNVQNQRVGTMTFLSFPDFLIGRHSGPSATGGNDTTFSNVNSIRITAGLSYHVFHIVDQALFIADDWKVHPKLTLNLGLRYEILGNPVDTRGLISNFDYRLYRRPPPGGVSSAGYVMPSNTIKPIAGIPLVSDTLQDEEDRNNLAPRFGIAFRPRVGGNLVIRAGYGIFYERLQLRDQFNALGYSGLPWALATRPSGAANAASSLDNPFPAVAATSEFPLPIEIPSFTSGKAAISPLFINPTNRTPYIQQYNLNVQQKLASDLVLEVGYAGSKGTKLINWIEFNQPYFASPSNPVNGLTTNTAANAPQRVPFEGFTHPGLRGPFSAATSNYNSLQASLTKRFSHGLSFLGSYTFAKALSVVNTGGENLVSVFFSGAQDQRDIRGTGYGPQNFDRSHRFVFSYGYQIPYPKVNAWTTRLLGGWQASGIFVMQSGLPFSVTDSRGGTLYGSTGSRADFAPGATIDTAQKSGSVHSRMAQYFNTAAFAPARAITSGTTPDGFPVSAPGGTLFGLTGRNIMRGPGQWNNDLALRRMIRVTEKARLELRAEFFNLFNTVNFGNPGSEVSNAATFGVISSTSSSPRVLQFALKLAF